MVSLFEEFAMDEIALHLTEKLKINCSLKRKTASECNQYDSNAVVMKEKINNETEYFIGIIPQN